MTIHELASQHDGNYFSAAQGLYWYCVNYHGGQSSDLYRMQCELRYTPAMSENGCDDDAFAAEVYLDLIAGHLQAADVLAWVQSEYERSHA